VLQFLQPERRMRAVQTPRRRAFLLLCHSGSVRPSGRGERRLRPA
jgi:hypothetical protein